jgi:Uma2 family endonuclease
MSRAPAGRIQLTYDDYVGLPDDGRRYEILDGDLEVSPAPTPKHQAVSLRLLRFVDRHVEERSLGCVYVAPIDVILAPSTVVQPDLLFIARGRESIVTARAIEGPPDLIVEVVSPASGRRDRGARAALYARSGVRCYWIADPEMQTFEVYELEGSEFRLAGRYEGAIMARAVPFPDLEMDLGRVWV